MLRAVCGERCDGQHRARLKPGDAVFVPAADKPGRTEGPLWLICPDITSLTQFAWRGGSAERGRSALSSRSVSADGIVFAHNLHCICSRRGWKSLRLFCCFGLKDPCWRPGPAGPFARRPPSAPAHIFWEVKPGFPRFHCRCLLNAHSHPLI